MKHQRYLFLAAVVAAITAVLWAGWHGLRSRLKPAVFACAELTSDMRARIDRIAAASPLETVEQEQINFAGDITAWLIGHALPSAEEEASHADGVRQQILSKYPISPAPAFGERIMRRLTDPLPPHLKPASFTYTLTVLDVAEPNAFTCGGGSVYITRSLLEALCGEGERGEAALAFVLAHELGHIALLHCRRGWQWVELQEEANRGLQFAVPAETLRSLMQTSIAAAGSMATFFYSRNQEYEADLFALHLCQSAGFAADDTLDGMRYLVTWSHPAILTQDDYRPDPAADRSALGYFLSAGPDTLFRLKRLLLERDGIVEDAQQFGLFAYERTTGALQRCAAASMRSGQRPLVLIHGLGGGADSFAAFLAFLAKQEPIRDRPLLVFRYPNNESLARCGRFLRREVDRVIGESRSASFICHSAGGLVFRYYAEIEGGGFDRAVFLGTPHRGSELARLRLLAAVAEYGRDFAAGLSLFGPHPQRGGRGQIVHDLHPDSLFLRRLGNGSNLAQRYHVFYGLRLDRLQALALRTSFAASALLRRQLADTVPSPCLRRCARQLLSDLIVPDEVLDGDLAVTVHSACLEGAGGLVETALDHQALKSDETVMGRVLRVLEGSGENR